MPKLVRFGVSLEESLFDDFNRYIRGKGYGNRSEAIRDLIRDGFVKKEWSENKVVAGAIILVYDHHKRELVNTLTGIQHDFRHLVISSQHIHLSHSNCLETVVVKGKAKEIESLADKMKSTKGVKYGTLTTATMAKGL